MTRPPDIGELFDTHHLALFRYFWRMTRRRDAAEDLTQEVFVRVLRGADRYEARDRDRAWLFRIGRNLLLDRLRQDGRRPVTAMPPEDPAAGPMQALALELDDSLERLDDLDREVFLLREVSGLGYVEIAAVCDLTPDAVRSRICRARSKLRVLLGSSSLAHP